ncbi:MAG TPA: hypothetical protein VID26_01290 [Candidatus Limnocylindrales bacterium]
MPEYGLLEPSALSSSVKPVGTVGTAAAGAAEAGALEAGALAGADEVAGVVADGAGGTGVVLLEQAPTSNMTTTAIADVLRTLVVINCSSFELP